MALAPVMRRLKEMGGVPTLREAVKKDGPVITDQGNFIVDVRFPPITDPGDLDSKLNGIPGVVENGLFVKIADLVLVGVRRDGTVRRME
jgi:ribose 5-phosphate isomerase A